MGLLRTTKHVNFCASIVPCHRICFLSDTTQVYWIFHGSESASLYLDVFYRPRFHLIPAQVTRNFRVLRVIVTSHTSSLKIVLRIIIFALKLTLLGWLDNERKYRVESKFCFSEYTRKEIYQTSFIGNCCVSNCNFYCNTKRFSQK
jgi:hypothetical protein